MAKKPKKLRAITVEEFDGVPIAERTLYPTTVIGVRPIHIESTKGDARSARGKAVYEGAPKGANAYIQGGNFIRHGDAKFPLSGGSNPTARYVDAMITQAGPKIFFAVNYVQLKGREFSRWTKKK